jgi:glycosyltransferase involved in cell wall biosynthesis
MNSDSNPRISIVLPTYNRAGYIVETIESVRRQVFSDWELLVIDDCSQDNTEQLVTQINDPRVKYFKTPERLRITATRGEGVNRATGEFIAFIDSDDLWDGAKLEKQIRAFAEYPDAGFCVTGAYNFKKSGEPLEFYYQQKDGIKYGDLLIPFFKSEVAALTPTLIFKKNCFKTIAFSNHVELIMQLARHFKGIVLYEALLFRRLHDSNISSIEWEDREKAGIELLLQYKKFVPRGIARDTLFKAYLNSGEHYLGHGRRRMAVRQFINAYRQKPFSAIPFKKIAKALLFSQRK